MILRHNFDSPALRATVEYDMHKSILIGLGFYKNMQDIANWVHSVELPRRRTIVDIPPGLFSANGSLPTRQRKSFFIHL